MMLILPLMNFVFAMTIIDAAFLTPEVGLTDTYLWTVWTLFLLTYLLMWMMSANLDPTSPDNRQMISANAFTMMANAMIAMLFIYCHAVMPDLELPLMSRLHLWVLAVGCLFGWVQISKVLWKSKPITCHDKQ